MRLSEAIRLGAMLKPQEFTGAVNGKGTCALLAATEACGMELFRIPMSTDYLPPYVDLALRYPFLRNVAACPETYCHRAVYVKDVMGTIWHLNDSHRWTRERIADWVEQIELTLEAHHHAQHVVAER
jgi:hypothetical protein